MYESVWSIGWMTLIEETEILGEKHFRAWVVVDWMSIGQWGNDTDIGKLKYWEKNVTELGW